MDRIFEHFLIDIDDHKRRCGFYQQQDPFNLTPYERLAIWTWSLSHHPVAQVNKKLRQGHGLKDFEAAFCALLTGGVRKLPAVSGRRVYRGITFGQPESEVRAQFGRGTDHHWPHFSSAATDINSAYTGDILIFIESISARPLALYAQDPFEHEALFLPGTRFQSLGGWTGQNAYVVYLQEVL